MSKTTAVPPDFKPVLKEALREVLNEQRELFYDIVVEAMEDIGLERAIREGENSEPVSRKEVMRALRSKR